MIFRVRHETKGAHVRCEMFAGKHDGALGKCGDFVMRAEEFDHFAWLLRVRAEFAPEKYQDKPSPRSSEIARRVLDAVQNRLSPQEYERAYWQVTTALDDCFELGVRSAGSVVVDLAAAPPRGYERASPPLGSAAIAEDWFTLPPDMRTKERLLEMLAGAGEARR